jgi:hypothetical protein
MAMRRTNHLLIATLLLAAPSVARAQAWPVTHQWSDIARPGDPTSGSYAWEYGAGSVAIAGSMTATGEKWDCSKFAMSTVVRYAYANGLEIQFTLPDPGNDWKITTVSSNDPRFHSFNDFVTFYRSWINAKMVAKYNTTPITYQDWRPGDLVLLSWKQLGANDPFTDDQGNPRDVWHTYFVGEPGKLLFYGNDTGPNNDPLPITATSEQFRLDEAMGKGDTGPAVYQNAPRRWNFLVGQLVPPSQPLATTVSPLDPQQATVSAGTLNVRATPAGALAGQVHGGDKLAVEGTTQDGWVRVRREDGSVAYVSKRYVTIAPVAPRYDINGGDGPDRRFDPPAATPPSTTDGIDHVLGGHGSP